jgi:predicted transcriptional regulator
MSYFGYHQRMPDSELLKRQKALSRVAFGQEWRLPVLLAVMQLKDSPVTQTAVAKELAVEASSVQNALSHLVKLGLLTFEPVEGQRFKFYSVTDSAIWAYASELAEQAATSPAV